jgi:hypothetical protein
MDKLENSGDKAAAVHAMIRVAMGHVKWINTTIAKVQVRKAGKRLIDSSLITHNERVPASICKGHSTKIKANFTPSAFCSLA